MHPSDKDFGSRECDPQSPLLEEIDRLRHRLDESEAVGRTKSEFIAHMSHEIRTPLTGIIGMADILNERIRDGEERVYVGMIREQARSLLAIVGDVLDLSKIEAGKREMQTREFSLRELLQSLLEQFLVSTRQKGLFLSLEIDPDLPDPFRGDADMLGQILRNLVSNAVKFTRKGGIVLSVGEGEHRDGRFEVSFSVADTGSGIPEEKRHLLFRKFSRIEEGRSKSADGTGLGLAISQRLVELMGGRIGVESEPGRGSVFRFSVILEEAAPARQPYASPGGVDLSAAERLAELPPLSILLAEDNRINRIFLETVLRDAGHRVAVAENGREAVGAAEQERFDLILMDVQMPELDGIGATGAIRTFPGKGEGTDPAVPIIALTAFAMADDEAAFYRAGMNGYVTKPIDFDRLAREIARVIRVT